MHAMASKRFTEYEMVYVLSPSTTPAGASKLAETIQDTIKGNEGKLLKVELWGLKRLAFKISGKDLGIYYYLRFVGSQGLVDEMERRLKISDSVLRFLTVRTGKAEIDPSAVTAPTEDTQWLGIDEIHTRLMSPEPIAEAAADGEAGAAPAAGAAAGAIPGGVPDVEVTAGDDDDEDDED